jgi:DNA-binding YbaB/EbfC family protein
VFGEGQPDMSALLAQAAQMQEQLMSAQAELTATQIEGTSGGGLVSATVSGTGELLGLSIQPAACDPDDTETLADLIVAAVRDANTNAQQLAADKLGPLAGGLGGLGIGAGDQPGAPPADPGAAGPGFALPSA